ncbi:hypothetical protein BDK51DRAFT_44558, partial [Blyttiomyces helicus]
APPARRDRAVDRRHRYQSRASDPASPPQQSTSPASYPAIADGAAVASSPRRTPPSKPAADGIAGTAQNSSASNTRLGDWGPTGSTPAYGGLGMAMNMGIMNPLVQMSVGDTTRISAATTAAAPAPRYGLSTMFPTIAEILTLPLPSKYLGMESPRSSLSSSIARKVSAVLLTHFSKFLDKTVLSAYADVRQKFRNEVHCLLRLGYTAEMLVQIGLDSGAVLSCIYDLPVHGFGMPAAVAPALVLSTLMPSQVPSIVPAAPTMEPPMLGTGVGLLPSPNAATMHIPAPTLSWPGSAPADAIVPSPFPKPDAQNMNVDDDDGEASILMTGAASYSTTARFTPPDLNFTKPPRMSAADVMALSTTSLGSFIEEPSEMPASSRAHIPVTGINGALNTESNPHMADAPILDSLSPLDPTRKLHLEETIERDERALACTLKDLDSHSEFILIEQAAADEDGPKIAEAAARVSQAETDIAELRAKLDALEAESAQAREAAESMRRTAAERAANIDALKEQRAREAKAVAELQGGIDSNRRELLDAAARLRPRTHPPTSAKPVNPDSEIGDIISTPSADFRAGLDKFATFIDEESAPSGDFPPGPEESLSSAKPDSFRPHEQEEALGAEDASADGAASTAAVDKPEIRVRSIDNDVTWAEAKTVEELVIIDGMLLTRGEVCVIEDAHAGRWGIHGNRAAQRADAVVEQAESQMPSSSTSSSTFAPYTSSLSRFRSFRFNANFDSNVSTLTYSNKVDPFKTMCPVEIADGMCSVENCKGQHLRDISILMRSCFSTSFRT